MSVIAYLWCYSHGISGKIRDHTHRAIINTGISLLGQGFSSNSGIKSASKSQTVNGRMSTHYKHLVSKTKHVIKGRSCKVCESW